MQHVDGDNLHAIDGKRVVLDGFQSQHGHAGIFVFGKGVIKVFLDNADGSGQTVNVYGLVVEEVDGSHIVDAAYMVGVLVGEQNGVDVRDFVGQQLLPQVGTGINEQFHSVHFHKGGGAQPMVPWIRGIAHVAGASHNGDALRCASS